MNPKKLLCTIGLAGILSAGFSIAAFAVNPYMPLWEHVADAEPHVFTDPETGEERVYVYGSHDINKTEYCGNNYVVWSAPVDDLTNWTNHGVAFEIENEDGVRHNLAAPDVCQGPDGKFYMYTTGVTISDNAEESQGRPCGNGKLCISQ